MWNDEQKEEIRRLASQELAHTPKSSYLADHIRNLENLSNPRVDISVLESGEISEIWRLVSIAVGAEDHPWGSKSRKNLLWSIKRVLKNKYGKP